VSIAKQSVGEPSTEPDPRRWRALSVTLTAGFMTLLDVSIVAVALPSIQHSLATDAAGVQWVVSGYALTFGLALVPAGRVGDALGRRRMFLLALAGFVVCSALAGMAPTIGLLIAARLAQGLAAGALAPQNSALIQSLFRGAERGRAFGLFGATVGISTAVGPVVGGVLLALAGGPEGWRWIFLVNVPVGVVALVLAARLLPRDRTGRSRGDLDLVGVALLGTAVLAVMLPLVRASTGGLAQWWQFPVGVALAAAFVAWENRVVARGREPLLDLRLVRGTPGYAAGATIGFTYFIGFSGIWIVLAVFFQAGLGYPPLWSGLAVTPFALGSAMSSALGGRLVERHGRTLTVLGLTGVTVGLAAVALVLLLVPPASAGLAVAAPMLLAGIGGGLVISPNLTLTLRCVPVRSAGSAGGALQTGQRIGAAVGTAGLAGLFYATLAGTGGDYPVAVATALGGALVPMLVALALAIRDRRRRPDRGPDPEPAATYADHL
jgi:EmrB/QacA subfamily drug resistance transporter